MKSLIADLLNVIGNIISLIAGNINYFLIIIFVLVVITEIADAIINSKKE